MNRPWMPLYIADYLADTAHLNAAQSGAYLHLIMHYWQSNRLPNDDPALARIAKMTPGEWKKNRPIVAAFFDAGWKHKRIEHELTEVARISAAGRTGGKASAEARKAAKEANEKATINERSLERLSNETPNDQANDISTNGQALHSPSQSKERKKEEDAPSGAQSSNIATNGKYAFEAGVIKLNAKDLEQWRKAFPNLSLESELTGLSAWAADQRKWFNAVAGALTKRQRLVFENIQKNRQDSERPQAPKSDADYWDRGL